MTLFVVINCLAIGLILSPSVVAVQSSTDQLMRNIVLNQSTDYYDDHTIEHFKTDPSLLSEASVAEGSPGMNTSAVANLEKLIALVEKDIADKKKRNAEMVEAASQTMLGGHSLPARINFGDHSADNLTINKPYKTLSAINEFPPDFMSDRVSLLYFTFYLLNLCFN